MNDFNIRARARQIKLNDFIPSENGLIHRGLFGLPFTADESELVVLAFPWDVTSSYGSGSSAAPGAIRDASLQVDLYHETYPGQWRKGMAMAAVPEETITLNDHFNTCASAIIEDTAKLNLGELMAKYKNEYESILLGFENLTDQLEESATALLNEGKIVGLLGGDHSTPLGLVKALAKKYPRFSVLHIDAHADLRIAYEGFEYSHASVMQHFLKISQVEKIVQLGLRDMSEEEYLFIQNMPERLIPFTDRYIHNILHQGLPWSSVCDSIIENLGDLVYISFDIDGLDPALCPHTGTPVPGGLSFRQVTTLFEKVHLAGKRIIGFDLCEVNPGREDDWDANVGMRVLYEMCSLTLSRHPA